MAQNVDDIVVGASWPLTGPNSVAAIEGLSVAQATIDAFNARGGVRGRKVRLLILDDEFNPVKAALNAQKLNEQGVVSLFNCWGTASCGAMVAIINAEKLPLVAGIAGGGPMRTTIHRTLAGTIRKLLILFDFLLRLA